MRTYDAAGGAVSAMMKADSDLARSAVVANASDWAQVWFSLAQHSWQSLVLIPDRAGSWAASIGESLTMAAQLYEEQNIGLVQAEGVTPSAVRQVVAELNARKAAGQRTVVIVGSPLVEPGAIPIARSCDASVLLVSLARTHMSDARRLIGAVGQAHFLGAITVAAR
jgi:hypothetical protein